MLRVRVLSRRAIERNGPADADAVISIRPSAPMVLDELDLALAGDRPVLRLMFDDVAVPAYGPYRGPTIEHVVAAMDFATTLGDHAPDGVLAVHCEHGVSRSAAIALTVLAQEHGPGQEQQAVAELLRGDVEGKLRPNPLVVSLADACLYRYGRLDAALAEASPPYAAWRDHWRQVAFNPDRYWRQAQQVRIRRKS